MRATSPPPIPISRDSTPSPTEPSLRTPPLTPRERALNLDLAGEGEGDFGASGSGSAPHTPTPRRSHFDTGITGLSTKSTTAQGGSIMGASSSSSTTTSASAGSSVRRASIRRTGNGNVNEGPSSPSVATRRVSCREDDGLVMREKDEGSVGRAGGVDVGVTRPKRRLSSLPSLPHPFHSGNRALSQSSPPSSPRNAHAHNSTYTSLAQTLPQPPYQRSSTRSMHPNKMSDEKHQQHAQGYFPASSPAPVQAKEQSSPRLFGIELKWISLVTLALQNAFLTIIMHYSRITASPNKTYSAASAVLLNELLKGTISVFIALRNIDQKLSSPSHPLSEKDALRSQPLPPRSGRFSMLHPSRLQALRQAVFSPDCVKLSIPAILYVIQNNLQYVAASNLDVATFQVTYQMKILTTAAFSVVLLRKRLSPIKWFSLVLLAAGVGIVQIQTTSAPSAAKSTAEAAETISHAAVHLMNPFKGFLAVTAACMTSGLAGVYFEFILKANPSAAGASAQPQQQPDLWVRNTQLSLFSLIPALVPILWGSNGDAFGPVGRLMAAFSNFNMWAVGTVLTQTFGGLITAVVIRYSDNIMKGFATSLSIIISFLASVALFSYPITIAFLAGSTIVLAATFLYNAPQPAPATSSRKDMAIPPGSPISTSAPILGEPEKPSRASSVISLLGLAGSRPPSRTPSRAPSGENLRHMSSLSSLSSQHSHSHAQASGNSYGMPAPHPHPHVYAASAPGTPYLSSGSYAPNQGVVPPFGPTPGHANGNGNGNGATPNFAPLPVPARAGPPPRISRKGSAESTSSSASASSSAGSSVLAMGSGAGVGRESPKPILRVHVG